MTPSAFRRRRNRPLGLAAFALLLAGACTPGMRPPTDVTSRLPHPAASPNRPVDPVEAARVEALWKISMVEIARPFTPDGFAPFTSHADPSVRIAAATGLGRAGEALAGAGGDAKPFVDALLPMASTDASAEVRAAAIAALGLIGEPATGRIEAPFAAESNADVRAKWVRAAGRIAPLPPASAPDATPAMVSTTAGAASRAELEMLGGALKDDALAGAAAWALGVYGARAERAGAMPVVPAATLDALRSRFENTAGAAREPFAYALWRLRQFSTTRLLRDGLSDPDPQVRAWCARGLGAIPGTHARREVARLLRDSNVWTRVEAARALPKLADRDSTAAVDLVELLERSDPPAVKDKRFAAASPHAAVAAAEALGELRIGATAEPLRSRLGTDDPYLFAAVVGAYAKAGGLSAIPDLADSVADHPTAGEWRFRKSIAEALAGLPRAKDSTPDPETAADAISETVPAGARRTFAQLLADADMRVRAAALDSYAELAGVAARARLVAVLGSSNDIAMAGTAADRLAALGKDAGPAAAPALVDALSRSMEREPDIATMLVPDAVKLADPEKVVSLLETAARSPDNALMLAADKALRGMKRTPPPRTVTPEGAVTLEDFVTALDLTRATLTTARGEIKIVLRPDVAPLTVLHLAVLAHRGFFHGLSFHRVVPAFVAQGGDPRGDGWGGSGETIPCELSDLPYVRGTLGMALSGRDTGDSQFFLTLTPQPHLEENYTVFGQVSRGEEILDALQVGDAIEDFTLGSGAPRSLDDAGDDDDAGNGR